MSITSLEYSLFFASLILPILTHIYFKVTVSKATKMMSRTGLTGAEVAQKILESEGLNETKINHSASKSLSDHYNPIDKSLTLSEKVYGQKSIAAVAIAAHEVGHAIQDKNKYRFLVLRTTSYPLMNITSRTAPFIILFGLLASVPQLFLLGIALFAGGVFFALITLPVEFDASRIAKVKLSELGMIDSVEMEQVNKTLNAAALTYVAAALVAILEIVRLILIYKNQD